MDKSINLLQKLLYYSKLPKYGRYTLDSSSPGHCKKYPTTTVSYNENSNFIITVQ